MFDLELQKSKSLPALEITFDFGGGELQFVRKD